MRNTFIPAAVLIPVFADKTNELRLIFTRRSEKVQHHKKQISFPGGMVDVQDHNLWKTALRETEEEIGIKPHQIFYVCELPSIKTISQFEVTPFVGFIHSDFQIIPNADEIDTVFDAPVEHFLRPESVHHEEIEFSGERIAFPHYYYNDHEIWGATGRILKSLLDRW
ncbi:MAG: NTP pyrophosphohydrolase, NUDIX family protein [uncultured bacterium]|nr:MAG: NTP pyrophosphohydrolase, NUDIX family protein [uncultured bacterium]HLD44994.1 CoA pyrophosphatase [bacterium]